MRGDGSTRWSATDAGPLLAHLFSLLPKIGLDEAMVPEPLLAHLAKRIAHAGAMVEVNEKWSCPSARTVAAMAPRRRVAGGRQRQPPLPGHRRLPTRSGRP